MLTVAIAIALLSLLLLLLLLLLTWRTCRSLNHSLTLPTKLLYYNKYHVRCSSYRYGSMVLLFYDLTVNIFTGTYYITITSGVRCRVQGQRSSDGGNFGLEEDSIGSGGRGHSIDGH
jgi:hypothetical protein